MAILSTKSAGKGNLKVTHFEWPLGFGGISFSDLLMKANTPSTSERHLACCGKLAAAKARNVGMFCLLYNPFLGKTCFLRS